MSPSIQETLRVLDEEMARALLRGANAIEKDRFAHAWESAAAWRQTAIILFVRRTGKILSMASMAQSSFSNDVIFGEEVSAEQMGAIDPSLLPGDTPSPSGIMPSRTDVLRNFCDFVFCFFGRRYIASAFDVYMMMMAGVEEDIPGGRGSSIAVMKEIMDIAKQSSFATQSKIDSMTMGLSGMYYYYPDRLLMTRADAI